MCIFPREELLSTVTNLGLSSARTAGHLVTLPHDMLFRKKRLLGCLWRTKQRIEFLRGPKLILKHLSGI